MSKYIRVRLKDIKPNSKLDWSKEQLDMETDIINNYNPRIKPILVSSDNKVCDGNHRYSILMNHYGGEHKIIVKQSVYSRRWYDIFVVFCCSIIGIIGLPFYLLYKGLKRIIN